MDTYRRTLSGYGAIPTPFMAAIFVDGVYRLCAGQILHGIQGIIIGAAMTYACGSMARYWWHHRPAVYRDKGQDKIICDSTTGDLPMTTDAEREAQIRQDFIGISDGDEPFLLRLLDEARAERDDARGEREAYMRSYEGKVAEIAHLEKRIDELVSANDRPSTSPDMERRFEPKKSGRPRRTGR